MVGVQHDTIFPCLGDPLSVIMMIDILNMYEKISGQLINKNKFDFMVYPKASIHIKNVLNLLLASLIPDPSEVHRKSYLSSQKQKMSFY